MATGLVVVMGFSVGERAKARLSSVAVVSGAGVVGGGGGRCSRSSATCGIALRDAAAEFNVTDRCGACAAAAAVHDDDHDDEAVVEAAEIVS
jgi:hypothetical protein